MVLVKIGWLRIRNKRKIKGESFAMSGMRIVDG